MDVTAAFSHVAHQLAPLPPCSVEYSIGKQSLVRDVIILIKLMDKKNPFYYSINTISINHCRMHSQELKKSVTLLLKENVNKEYTCTVL